MDNNAVVNELSKSMGRDAKDIAALLDGITAIMREKLSAMDSIAIPGFGTFEPVKEDERIQNDLSPGKRLLLPPEITVQFKSSALLRRKISDR